MSYPRARLGDEFSTDEALANADTNVIAYRGAVVASRAGWIADAKARGGKITTVPSGFFQGIDAARFGSATPYTYELPPLWLVLLEGIDLDADAINRWANEQGIAEAADNQLQGLADLGYTAGDLAANLPTYLKYGAWLLGGALLLQVASYLPRGARE